MESQVTESIDDPLVDVACGPQCPGATSLGLVRNEQEKPQQMVCEDAADITPQVDERAISGSMERGAMLGKDPDNKETSGQYDEQLRKWALKHGISHMAVSDLLQILA